MGGSSVFHYLQTQTRTGTYIISNFGYQASGIGIELYHWVTWVLSFLTYRYWGLLDSITIEANFLISKYMYALAHTYTHKHTHIIPYWFSFSGETRPIHSAPYNKGVKYITFSLIVMFSC